MKTKGSLLPTLVLLTPLMLSLGCGMVGTGPAVEATTTAQPQSTPVAVQPTLSDCTGGLRIHSVTDRVEDGFVRVRGLVDNCTDQWVDIVVHLTLYDAGGNPLNVSSTTGETEQDAFVLNRPLAPGATGVFDYIRDTAYIEGTYNHAGLSADWVEAGNSYRGDITSYNYDINPDESLVTVSGTFKSTGAASCPSPLAVAVGYNEDGDVCSVNDEWLTDEAGNDIDELAPGETANFELLLDNFRGEVRDVKVLAGCSFYGMP